MFKRCKITTRAAMEKQAPTSYLLSRHPVAAAVARPFRRAALSLIMGRQTRPVRSYRDMSRSLNKIMLIGNVGNDPEIRATGSGTRVAKLSLATNRSWTDRNSGQKNEKTEWHRLTVFGRLVDVVEQWVKKGDRLYVEGRLEYSQTEGDGGPKYWTDIVVAEMVMLGSTGGGADGGGGGGRYGGGDGGGGAGGSGGGGASDGGAPSMNEPDDDLPF
jgi:single-strand DNA-binding protein